MGIQKYTTEIQEVQVPGKVICPLTGKEITDEDDYICLYSDCRNVKEDMYYPLFDSEYRCDLEKDRIRLKQNQIMRFKNKITRNTDGYEKSKDVDHTLYLKKCAEYQNYIETTKMNYKDMIIKPFCEEGETNVVVSYKGEQVTKVVKTDCLFSALSNLYNAADDKEQWSVGIVKVEEEFATVLQAYLCLEYGLNVTSTIKIDNPVYIKSTDIYKYVDVVYALEPHQLKKILQKNLWITEKVNSNYIVYIKQELDKAIRQEAMLKLSIKSHGMNQLMACEVNNT